jgi:aspartyl/asparaginyl-tRNA synthetase
VTVSGWVGLLHGGFAIGLERWVTQLVGAANIRETTLFPCDLHRLTPLDRVAHNR